MALATARTKLQRFLSKASGLYRDHEIEFGPDSDHHDPSKTYAGTQLQTQEEVQTDCTFLDLGYTDGLCHSCQHLLFGYRQPLKVHYLPFYTTWSLLQWEEEMEPSICQLCKVRKDILLAWSRLVYRYVPLKVLAPPNVQRLLPHDIYFIKAGPLKSSLLTIRAFPASLDEPQLEQLNIETANLPRAREWYQHCHDHHTCWTGQIPCVPYLKLIDCTSGQIREAITGCRYVALSYVWGASAIKSPPIPNDETPIYPNSVKDAMLVAINLGIPYLWVDRYCIDQDNEDEKHSLISSMNSVYSGAEITIIAAAGSDPHYGLPGVSTTERKGVEVTTLRGGSLIRYPDPGDELTAYPWSTRGWT